MPGAGTQAAAGADGFRLRRVVRPGRPDAYERLLLDAMLGDPTLFARRDEVEAAWSLMQPILDVWADQPATNADSDL